MPQLSVCVVFLPNKMSLKNIKEMFKGLDIDDIDKIYDFHYC